jgi:hypothetical protein
MLRKFARAAVVSGVAMQGKRFDPVGVLTGDCVTQFVN